MNVAVVGSRGYKNLENVLYLVRCFPEDTVIVSGGALGPDSAAEREAEVCKLPKPIVIKAEWEKYGRGAGFRRNPDIVLAAERVYAFYDGRSKGTMDTMKHTKAQDKPLVVFDDRAYSHEEIEEKLWTEKRKYEKKSIS